MSNPDLQSRNRILVVRLGAMGDVLHALPAVSTLRASFPDSEITWAIDPKWAVLLEGNPAVDHVMPVNRRNLQSIWTAFRTLRSKPFCQSFDLQGLIKSAILPYVAGGCQDRWGFHPAVLREKQAAWLYKYAFQPSSIHVVDQGIEIVRAAGARQVDLSFPLPRGTPEGVLPSQPFVLASPFAGWPSKQWPVEYFAELARLIAPIPLVVNGAPASELELRTIIDNVHVHVSGVAGLIDATRHATAVVGVDSGPMHLAAALNKPGVAIFGPTNPARNGPYGGTIQVLRERRAETTYKRTSEIAASMRAIRPAAVFEKLKPLLP